MENFQERFSKTTELIEQEIVRSLPKGKVENLYDAIRYSMESKGKRLRPFICVEVARLLGSDVTDVLPFAVSCEFMHNWLLMHDDILDGDEIRRNQPSVWKKFGVAPALNAGDLMAHETFGLVLDSDLEQDKVLKLVKLIVKTITETIEGQTIEANFRDSDRFDEKEYETVALKKTGYYLACPVVGAAIIAGSTKEITESLLEYGKNVGVAFQIIDDVIDLTTKKGREIGSDIKEGKKTPMVLHLLRNCSPQEKQQVLDILKKLGEETTRDDISFVAGLFEQYGSTEYAKKKSQEFAKRAKDALVAEVPENVRDFLNEFADFVVKV